MPDYSDEKGANDICSRLSKTTAYFAGKDIGNAAGGSFCLYDYDIITAF